MKGGKDRRKGGWGGIEIYQDMAGEKGMESRVTRKWDVRATRGRAGSIELNWDCLSNFEEKPTPLFLRLGCTPQMWFVLRASAYICTHGQRGNFQSRESSFESHFPFLRAKFNFLYQKAIWEMGNEMWAFWNLISNFLSLTSHFLYLAYCLITQLSFNFLFPQWNFISSSSLLYDSHPSLFNQL